VQSVSSVHDVRHAEAPHTNGVQGAVVGTLQVPVPLHVAACVSVPLVHEGVNPHIAAHVAAIPPEETVRLRTLNDAEPWGVLAVCDDLDPDRAEGTELTYLHGVATTGRPEGLDTVEVPAGTWAVFRTEGPYPTALQEAWAATATEWFPSHPWRLRPGPEIVATLAFDADAGTATCELWLPVEPD
jgi:AraC family transcriptional regulator